MELPPLGWAEEAKSREMRGPREGILKKNRMGLGMTVVRSA